MKINLPDLFIVFLVLAGFAMTSCSKDTANTGALYVPGDADATANASLQDLQQGRALYIDNCAGCHSLYSPDDYTSSQWQGILTSMAPRTALSASEVQLVKKYVSRGK